MNQKKTCSFFGIFNIFYMPFFLNILFKQPPQPCIERFAP